MLEGVKTEDVKMKAQLMIVENFQPKCFDSGESQRCQILRR